MLIDSTHNKQKILQHFLEICIFEGWNENALKQSMIKAEIDIKFLPFIFENGCIDLTKFFIEQVDKKMQKEVEDINFSEIKIRDKIKTLIKARLKINQEFKPQLQKLIQFYFTPQNICLAFKSSYKTADLIWTISGDNSTDFNFYSKRLILAKIYIRVLLCFIKDNSTNNQKTINLLDQQIEKVMNFAAFKFKVRNNFWQAKKCFDKTSQIKQDLCNSPRDFIKKLPFIRLFK
jgi:ubiquinone biosynthesis protein COQ9